MKNTDEICLGNWRERNFSEAEIKVFCEYLDSINPNRWNSKARIDHNSRGRFLIGVPDGYYGTLTASLDGIDWKLYKSVYGSHITSNQVFNPEIVIELTFYGRGYSCLHKASDKTEDSLYTFYDIINKTYEEIVRKIAEPFERKAKTGEVSRRKNLEGKISSFINGLRLKR